MDSINHGPLAVSLAHLVGCMQREPGLRLYGVYQHPGCSRALHLPLLSDLLGTVAPFVASPAEALTVLAGLIACQGAGRLGVDLGGLVGVAVATMGWRIDFDHPDAPRPDEITTREGLDEQPYAHFGLQLVAVCADDVVHTITGYEQGVTKDRNTIAEEPGLHVESLKAVFTALKGPSASGIQGAPPVR